MIDLRSDTVTRPSAAMRTAMAEAEVGDDVFGDDPTVAKLEDVVATLTGHEAGMFAPSGTQANLCALMSHCDRGDEYLVGDRAHTYMYEGGGAAVLGSIQPQPVPIDAAGQMDLTTLGSWVKPIDNHFARTRLLALENTTDGRVLNASYVAEALAFAADRGLATHLDGARVWNAAVASGAPVSAITAPFDSVSVCLSKGLGAPLGSVLCGTEELVAQARRWRKMLGGGMRQVGIVAAAGLLALDNIDRLADDHERAQKLVSALGDTDGVEIVRHATNMVFVKASGRGSRDDIGAFFERRGILLHAPGDVVRLVTHLDIDDGAIASTLGAFAAWTAA